MKHRVSPYYLSMHRCGIIFSALVIIGGIVQTLLFPEYSDIGILLSVLGGILLVDLIRNMRLISAPWVTFSDQGISRTWTLGVSANIPWDQCAEIGVVTARFTTGIHHGALHWLYFSKTALSRNQSCPIKQKDLKSPDLILVEYYPKVLNDVLNYIPKEKIRNLHLIQA